MKEKLQNLKVPTAALIGVPLFLVGILVGGTVLVKSRKRNI